NSAIHLFHRELVAGEHEDIHLQHGFEVNHVEGSATPDGVVNHVSVNVEFVLESGYQRLDVVSCQSGHDVHVLRRPRTSVDGARNRAAHQVVDPELVELRDDTKRHRN